MCSLVCFFALLAQAPPTAPAPPKVLTVEQVKAVAQAIIALKDNEIAAQKARADFAEAVGRGASLAAQYEKTVQALPGWCKDGQLRADFTFVCPAPAAPAAAPPKQEKK